MTHTGPFQTPQGEVPPTGRTVVIDAVDVVTATDGKISSWRVYFDQMGILRQLGLLPAPASA
jgi:ketosteroid isomerase-like protein